MVEQHGITLPTYNAASLPNFPNYRLGPLDGSPCDTLGLNNEPVAKYRYEQDTNNHRTVHFTDLSYYEPAEWGWQFGDGTSSTEVNPLHTYQTDGAYEVCLTVANPYGINTYCRTLYIGVSALDDRKGPQAEVSVFPNPARSATNFRIGGDYLPRQAMLTLYTATGQPVLTERLAAGWSVVNLEGLPSGLYFYEVKDACLPGQKERLLGSGKLIVLK
jgi:PKD repeat protein